MIYKNIDYVMAHHYFRFMTHCDLTLPKIYAPKILPGA